MEDLTQKINGDTEIKSTGRNKLIRWLIAGIVGIGALGYGGYKLYELDRAYSEGIKIYEAEGKVLHDIENLIFYFPEKIEKLTE